MANPFDAPEAQHQRSAKSAKAHAGRKVVHLCNSVFLILFCCLVGSVGYTLETEGGGIRLVEIAIFPIGVLAIAMFFIAMYHNFKLGSWIWAIMISPIGLFLIFYTTMLIASQF